MASDSVHSRGIEEIHDMPISAITRPIQSELDDQKVCSLMDTINVSNQIQGNCCTLHYGEGKITSHKLISF